jgi:sulfonate transport system ATP-binding protein
VSASVLTLSERRASGAPSEARHEATTRHGVAITLSALTKTYGARVVLDAVDLMIEPGQFLAIVGRSGGGKTTLLRLIAGLERPSSGALSIDGVQKAARLVFQDPRLLPWQRVIANVGIARGPHWREESLQALQAVGLADRARDWPSVLSGGQRQRVALARALVSKPKVLLLDEPFAALDALTRAEMHRLLLRLWKERGFTVVLITHDIGEAATLADRVLALREGRIAGDFAIDFPRSRRTGAESQVARLKERILAEV